MGLLQKQKAAIERAKLEATHEIICLYCFRNFDHHEVHFRAAEVRDGSQAEPDQLLDAYRARFGLPAKGDIPPVLIPSSLSEKSKGFHHDILTTLFDGYNTPTGHRLCPHCHNDIQPGAGFAPSTVISVVGAGQAGKSTYFNSLLHQLKTNTSLNFQIYLTPVTGTETATGAEPLTGHIPFTGQIPPAVAEPGRPHQPTVYTVSFAGGAKPDLYLAFFEPPPDSNMDIYAACVRNSSGVIFLVDPQQFPQVAHRVQALNNLPPRPAPDPMAAFAGLLESYVHKQPTGISHIPAAAVLTKTDLLEIPSQHGEYLHPNSYLFANYSHMGYFSLTAYDIANYEAENFFHMVDPSFTYALKRRFANLGFFGVSALDVPPYGPRRVDEPFLWLLYKLGFIHGQHDEAGQ